MGKLSRINLKAKQNTETGLGTNSSYSGGRFFNKDGDPNVIIRGNRFYERLSLYQLMLNLSSARFIFIIVSSYLIINIFFAFVYYLIGINHLGGISADNTMNDFWQAFFFSAQTITTVGYGHIHPVGFVTSLIASVESLLGLLMFALATGLMYGRFSKPKAYILFSKNALLSPFKDGTALMFRFAPYKHHFLSDVEVRVTLGMKISVDGEVKNQFFGLDLELSKATTLTMNWTIVHVINEESPLYHLSTEDIEATEAELLVFVRGFDDMYSNTVIARSSYTFKEFVYGAKFKPMYHPNQEHSKTVLELSLLNAYEKVPMTLKPAL
jgi:inward rectifier potassium channel